MLDFLAYLEFERGLSRNTLEAYRSDLLQFGRFLEARGGEATLATAVDIGDFLAELAEGVNGRAPSSPATIHRKAACLRSFYRHLRREGLRDSDPTASISGPRRGRRLPKVLNRGEVPKLLSQPKGTAPTALRDRALLELMYACGLRASEAIGIEVADVDIEEAVLRARGKGSKERVVPVGRAALEAVRIYLERGRPALVHGGIVAQLFVNFRGEPLTRQGLYKIVRRHAATAGLAERMSPHTLRHTFATHLLAGGCDLRIGAGDARPRRRRHHPALHAPLERAPEGRLLQGAPARHRLNPVQPARWMRSPPRARGGARRLRLRGAPRRRRLRGRGHEHARARGRRRRRARAADAPGARPRERDADPGASSRSSAPAVHGRLCPLGPGKDTTAGHWEMMGVDVAALSRPTRDGFPAEVIAEFDARDRPRRDRQRAVRGAAGDRGARRAAPRTGELILYTSQDSVFQLAAHTSRRHGGRAVRVLRARRARILTGEHAVGRVIARPFDGEPGAFRRTTGRRDFALPPPGRSYLEEIARRRGARARRGQGGADIRRPRRDRATTTRPTTRPRSTRSTRLLAQSGPTFVFANLVDTDQLYGHRKDVQGFHDGAARRSTRRWRAGSSTSARATC